MGANTAEMLRRTNRALFVRGPHPAYTGRTIGISKTRAGHTTDTIRRTDRAGPHPVNIRCTAGVRKAKAVDTTEGPRLKDRALVVAYVFITLFEFKA